MKVMVSQESGDWINEISEKIIQNGNLTEIGGNAEIDGNLAVNGTLTNNGKTLLNTGSLKTLFGNQNIVGSGNIDLYRHIVKGVYASDHSYFLLTIISSNNLIIDSLTDLKTILGNTFEYPVSGYDGAQDLGYVRINQTGVYNTHNAALSLSNFTFTDTVTTV